MSFRRALSRFVRRRADDASMDAEMRHHIDLETRARIAAGLTPAEARRTALRDFGGIDRHTEVARDQRSLHWLEDTVRDISHATRVLRRNPAYAIAACLTLALGVGCATSIYSVVHGVLLRPLPYEHPDQLAVIWEKNAGSHLDQNVASVATFEALVGENRSFTSVAALVPQPVTIGGADPERAMGADVSPGYFRLLGASPALGRTFSDGDTLAGAPNIVVLSDALWRRRFGADKQIVGRSILFDQRPFTVIGVMRADFDPPKFGWLPEHDFWIPWVATADNRAWGHFLLLLGRLRPGVTTDMARRELVAFATRRASDDSRLANWSMNVVPLASQITGDVRRPLFLLLGAVALLLALAATNVGGLVLGFLRRRAPEHALRRAIGASGRRLFRELLAHVLVVGALGVAGGVGLAIVGTHTLVALLPPEIPRGASIALDAPVLAAGILVGLGAVLACALYAARRVSAESAGGLGGTRMTGRTARGSLVVAEVGLSVVLTVFAGLMARSFANLRAVPLGFESSGVVTARISLPNASYGSADRQRQFFDEFGQRLRAIPGVTAAGFVTSRPFECCAPSTGVVNPAEPALESGTVSIRYADSAYFAALRVATVAGRGFAAHEQSAGAPTVLINQQLARTLYHGDAVGKPIRIDLGDPVTNQPVTEGRVAGVMADVHLVDARTAVGGTAYLATTRFPSTVRDVVIRTDAPAGATIAAARQALHSLDAAVPLAMAGTLDDSVNKSLARDRFITVILSVFALVSLALAAVGIYGMFAAEVIERRKEIGVRLALGARGGRIVAQLVRRAVGLSVVGAGVGAGAGLLLSRFMASVLFGVPSSDPLSFVAVSLLLVAVAIVATLIPAIRAATVSPLEVIRTD
jgi:predicted permease